MSSLRKQMYDHNSSGIEFSLLNATVPQAALNIDKLGIAHDDPCRGL